jgi:hypothetical protein
MVVAGTDLAVGRAGLEAPPPTARNLMEPLDPSYKFEEAERRKERL